MLERGAFKRLCIFGPKGAIQIRYYYYYYYYYYSIIFSHCLTTVFFPFEVITHNNPQVFFRTNTLQYIIVT